MNEWLTDPAWRFNGKPTRGPEPLGKKALRTLRELMQAPLPVETRTRQFERLRRSGYVKITVGGSVLITEAGRAYLARAAKP